ncbi:Gag-pol Polyprotein [Phytophthora megakarya]|uniref:Gag-pol Polyprotein n=1 Tax=Phytophthora megakarya TaxID=4795 RepID=A0A225V5J6_9STRA|nr:Gag-pol Polyprotein [Phytophthora megakarya]
MGSSVKSQTSDDQVTNTLANPVLKCNWKVDMVGGLYQSVVEIPQASRTLTTIKDMEAKQLVTGMKLTRDQRRVKENCLNCDMAKMKRMSFKKTKLRRPTVAFQKVFIDLAFIQDETIGGNTMYLHLIDEATRFQWIFLQVTKDETVDRLREFRDSGKADYDKVVKIYRSDQRTEFQNAEVAEQLRGESIQIFSHPHTPEEACSIEKTHGTLMNKVQAVLYSSGMPELLWGEAAAKLPFVSLPVSEIPAARATSSEKERSSEDAYSQLNRDTPNTEEMEEESLQEKKPIPKRKLRFVLLFAGLTKAVVKQFDFITSFLNAAEERVIYMEQPQGHVKRGYESWVCLLKEVSMDYGMETRLVLLPIYVDDILLIGAEQDVNSIAEQLKDRFQMNELGSVNYLLGLQIGMLIRGALL